MLLSSTGVAAGLQDPIVATLRACAIPKLEGKPISAELSSNLFLEAPARTSRDTRIRILRSYNSVSPQFDYKLDIYEKQGCTFTYSISAKDDVMSELDIPFSFLLKKFNVFQMGSPSDDNPGFNAYQVKSAFADFDVTTKFETKGDRTYVSISVPTE